MERKIYQIKVKSSGISNVTYALQEIHMKAKELLRDCYKAKGGGVAQKKFCSKCGQRKDKENPFLTWEEWYKSQKGYEKNINFVLKQLYKLQDSKKKKR